MKEMMNQIKYFIIDVDGTMTDGGIYYDEKGNELKKFCTRDAAGFFAAHKAGIKIIVLTGRETAATVRRMRELQVDYLFQSVVNKEKFLQDFISRNHIKKEEIAYIGDDLNDLYPMRLAGFVGCPADSCPEVIAAANYVSKKKGGSGAVRDVIEHIMRTNGTWDGIIKEIYQSGT